MTPDWKSRRWGGQPGIQSARYAGPGASDADRIEKLLQELERNGGCGTARFVCTLALAREGTILLESEGTCSGTIIREARGQNGFGYDPIFLFSELGKTFAELNEAEKNCYSHRARAVTSMLGKLSGVAGINCEG